MAPRNPAITADDYAGKGAGPDLQALLDAANATIAERDARIVELEAACTTVAAAKDAALAELAASRAEFAKFDADGDGHPGGSLPGHAVRVRHPDKIGLNVAGVAFEPKKDGTVTIPAYAVETAKSHGFEVVA